MIKTQPDYVSRLPRAYACFAESIEKLTNNRRARKLTASCLLASREETVRGLRIYLANLEGENRARMRVTLQHMTGKLAVVPLDFGLK